MAAEHARLVVGFGQLAPLDRDVHGVAPAKGVRLRAAASACAHGHLPPRRALRHLRQCLELNKNTYQIIERLKVAA